MEFREAVRARRSVRDFEPEPVSDETMWRLVDAARLAPSADNEQPWRFYVVAGEKRKQIVGLVATTTSHLREYVEVLEPDGHHQAAPWQFALGNAPILVAVTSPTTDDSRVAANRHIGVGAALENFLLAAVDEGLAACNVTFSHWVGDDIAALLGVPEGWDILTVVAVGKPGSNPPGEQQRRPDDTVWLK